MVIKEKERDVLIKDYNLRKEIATQICKKRWKKKILESLKLRIQ